MVILTILILPIHEDGISFHLFVSSVSFFFFFLFSFFFGGEKGLLQGQARRMGVSCSKTLNSPMVFREKFLIGKIWDESCRVCDFLLIGWWWGKRAVFQESCAQPEVTILHLGGGLSSILGAIPSKVVSQPGVSAQKVVTKKCCRRHLPQCQQWGGVGLAYCCPCVAHQLVSGLNEGQLLYFSV